MNLRFLTIMSVVLLFGCVKTPQPPLANSDWPTTCDGAVDKLIKDMDPDGLAELKAMPKDDLIVYHHGLGTAIRNEYGLWGGNTALIKDCGKLYPGNTEPIHPDTVSGMILDRLWSRLNSGTSVVAR